MCLPEGGKEPELPPSAAAAAAASAGGEGTRPGDETEDSREEGARKGKTEGGKRESLLRRAGWGVLRTLVCEMGLWIQALAQVRPTPQACRSEQRKCGPKGPRGRAESEGAEQRGEETRVERRDTGPRDPRAQVTGFSCRAYQLQ